jgi:hypothetical protein
MDKSILFLARPSEAAVGGFDPLFRLDEPRAPIFR